MILCCGGAGNVYAATSNTRDVTGDGYAMAARCGLPLRGMEFVQFYPYRIYSPKRADIFRTFSTTARCSATRRASGLWTAPSIR